MRQATSPIERDLLEVRRRTRTDWLTLAIVGLICLAVGLFAGLILAKLTEGQLGEVKAERDNLATKAAEWEAKWKDTDNRRAATLAELDDLKAEHERVRERWRSSMAEQLQSQAFVGLLIKFPQAREYLLSETFAKEYDASWFYPQLALKAMGGKWFVDDLNKQGLLGETPAIKDGATDGQWREVAKFTVSNSREAGPFAFSSPAWRVRWDLLRPDEGAMVSIAICRADGAVLQTFTGKERGSAVVRQPPGEYLLDVNTVFTDALIVVEEPQ